MKIKRFLGVVLAAIGVSTAAAAIFLSLHFRGADPILITPPEEAKGKVITLMDAVCSGDYEQVSRMIYGTPSLGVDRAPAEEVGVLIWNAFEDSKSYELLGDCYTTEQGLAQDISVTYMDVTSVTERLRERSQALLEQRIGEAGDISKVYDENNEYREEFVMQVLYDAAEQAVAEDARQVTVELTVNLSYQDGQWWVIADEALLRAVSGGILY